MRTRTIRVAVTSLPLKHQRVQRLRRLLGRRSARLADGAFVIEGAKVLSEALDAGAAIEAVYVVEGTADPVLDRALRLGVRVFDLATGDQLAGPLGNFFAFDPSFRGGITAKCKCGPVERPVEPT